MPQQPERRQPSKVSMRDLLASCAAASAVSTPPRPAPAGEPAPAGGPAPVGGAPAGTVRPEAQGAPRAA
ncbi:MULTISPECIES: hypothetical protein [Streptomyces]|uniref:Uncharacterized protein n=1 Tax=Streptomyces sudanensis TaxID=436397 RepID=A0ABY4TBH0_9ACTN|nr:MULTISPECIES: hypothetical protein [Streptomyces]MCP9957700.1 hypothetical protein [Streptomyces sudanensis]MCP9986818.1 hypothetical protein [Streptomyces sudanensis]MCQ0001758.1 hypothetical protein [Streptomyces sudanensis]URN15389.1 hypothetical protein MW084_04885 [Streptomyces sudanensis]